MQYVLAKLKKGSAVLLGTVEKNSDGTKQFTCFKGVYPLTTGEVVTCLLPSSTHDMSEVEILDSTASF